MRVLLAEDHEELAETVADVLRGEGMAVDVALDGEGALERAGINSYDVIVLDRDLPGVHGDDVCRSLVADGTRSRVLMLTAAGSVEDRVDGPFQRLIPDRSSHTDGTGLGLSIAKAIADAHNATVTAAPQPHGGLKIQVSFPAARRT